MVAKPIYVVRRADGSEAGAVFDPARQRTIGLQVADPELARLLAEHGILPQRPPLLDATTGGVHGAYAARPQRNWFLAPPLEDVVAGLKPILRPAGDELSRPRV